MKYLSSEGLAYLWSKIKALIPVAGDTLPVEDSTASAGKSSEWSRSDHVHPHDSTKVDKVTGKGLSTNDYTTEEKNKLSGVAEGANNYVLPTATSSQLGGIKLGSNLTSSSGVVSVPSATTTVAGVTKLQSTIDNTETTAATPKAVQSVQTTVSSHTSDTTIHVTSAEKSTWNAKSDFSGKYTDLTGKPTIPSKVSDLSNDAGYQTASQVSTAIANSSHLKRSVVTALPSTTDADPNTIYMILKDPAGSGNDLYNEYMLLGSAFELIGTSAPDLTDYVQTADLEAITTSEIDTLTA